MRSIVIEAKKRDQLGKYNTKKYRNEGFIPAVVYGDDVNQPVLIDQKRFSKLFDSIGEHAIVTVDIEGNKQDVLVRDYQEHPVTRKLIHVDFYKINPKRKVKTRIPVHPQGLAPGVKMGGVMEQYLHGLIVECLPDDIPEDIKIDISGLKLKQGIYVRDLDLGDQIKIMNQKDQAVFIIHVSRTADEVEAAEEGLETEEDMLGEEGEIAEQEGEEGEESEENAE